MNDVPGGRSGAARGEGAPYAATVRQLLNETWADDEASVEAAEQAVRLADAHGDVPLAVEARGRLIRVATAAGFPEKALVAFAWVLAQIDRDPGLQRHSGTDVPHLHKWAAGPVTWFAEVSRRQIEQTFDDMGRRFEAAGFGQRVVEEYRCIAFCDMGDLERAAEHERKWLAAARDASCDCRACEADEHVYYLLATGQVAKALEEAEPLVKGKMRCENVPHRTYRKLLLPLYLAGRVEEAEEYHRRAADRDKSGPKHIAGAGAHMTYLALRNRPAEALVFFERCARWAAQTRRSLHAFEFFLGARLLLRLLVESAHPTVGLRLPGGLDAVVACPGLRPFPAAGPDDIYPTADAAQWCYDCAADLAARLDLRDGNTAYADRLVESERLLGRQSGCGD